MELTVTESSDSSLGSAMLAGVAMGVFASFDEAAEKCIHTKMKITPNPENTKIYNEIFEEGRKGDHPGEVRGNHCFRNQDLGQDRSG